MAKWIVAAVIFLFAPTNSPIVAPSEIFAKNKNAVVRIYVNGQIAGCGFIISADGLIVTANHVVTTEESGFTELGSPIEVEKAGERKSHYATVLDHSDTSDTALLRLIGYELPHVTIGDWTAIQPSNAVAIITFLPGSGLPLLLTGTVSGTGMVSTGKIKANAIIFQMPIRKGFSGSPIFDERGQVVGIVSTRLIGISDDLDAARRQLKASEPQVKVIMTGVDFAKTLGSLIDSLNADLVSGLGSAVDIAYAKEMQAGIQNKKN
jgi:S1-C subfamily serine protease